MHNSKTEPPRILASGLVLVSDYRRCSQNFCPRPSACLGSAETLASRHPCKQGVPGMCAPRTTTGASLARVAAAGGSALLYGLFSRALPREFPRAVPVHARALPTHCPCIARACPCIARALPVLCPCIPVHEPSRTSMNVLRAPETYYFWNPRWVPPPPVVIMLAPLTRRHAARPLRNLGRTAALVSSTAAEHRIPAR